MRGPSTNPEGANATRGIAAQFGRGGRGGGRGGDSTTAGRGGRGANPARVDSAALRLAAGPQAGGRGARPDSAAADSAGGGRGGGGGFSTWDHGLGGCE